MATAINVEGLSKKYTLSHEEQDRYTALRDVVTNGAKRLAGKMRHPFQSAKGSSREEEFWALKDVTFSINQGDRVGIIGRNGAGKSTLLKILSRITEPTAGKFSIRGRVASLLEVGTGFHPELTGRENIFLNGAILGMGNSEIRSKFDQIVEFAEVERFLDTPVKRYSSGMYVRLAFAVAAHLEPEILIVDEILAVGDAQFQRKCLGKMEEVGKDGRTVLFVSHNMAMISNLCQKGILFEGGTISSQGEVSKVIHRYYANAGENAEISGRRIGSDSVELLAAELIGVGAEMQATIHDPIAIRMKYRIHREVDARLVPNFHFFAPDGSYIFVSSPDKVEKLPLGVYVAECTVPGGLLNEGAYFVGVAVTTHFDSGAFEVDFFERSALTFNIVDPMDARSARYGYAGPLPGNIRPRLDWRLFGDDE